MPFEPNDFPIEPRLRALADEALAKPKLRAAIAELRTRYYDSQESLVHGDVQAGNVLVQGERPRLLDAEIAHVGDSAFDLGQAFAHVHVHRVRARDASACEACEKALVDGYAPERAVLARARRYAGVEILRRAIGAARLLLLGTTSVTRVRIYNWKLARFNSDGTRDLEFNGGKTVDSACESQGFALALQADGRIVVAGDQGVFYADPPVNPGFCLERRLADIHSRVGELLDSHRPDALAIEELYFGANVRTAFAVGQARGVVLLAAAQQDTMGYRVGFQNFYVITRYNSSPLYAMAVYDLAQAIRDQVAREAAM